MPIESASGVESIRVLRGPQIVAFLILTISLFTAIVLVFSDLAVSSLWRNTFFTSALFAALLTIHAILPLGRWLLLPLMRKPRRQYAQAGWRVAVVTTYVPASEPLGMLDRTLRAMISIPYPHATWVLDEGDEEEVRDLCSSLGAMHFSRRRVPQYQQDAGPFQTGTKHGNYNAWLSAIGFRDYDIIVAFDPDHIPFPSFLDDVLGYFDDPKVGYVQAPQAYYNQRASFIAAGAAAETYEFNSTTQMASHRLGYPVVMGCHNAHRATALQQVGGFAAHDADDLLITTRYRSNGWRGVYVPRIVARGLTPVDWQNYLRQQRRWARSVLDLKFRSKDTLPEGTPLPTRLVHQLHGLIYLQPAFTFLGWQILAFSSLISGSIPAAALTVNPIHFLILAAVLTACHFFRQQFYLDPRNEWGLHIRARLLRIAKAPFLLLAFGDLFVRRRPKYELTSKVRAAPRVMVSLAFAPIAALVLFAWHYGSTHIRDFPWSLHALAIGWICFCLSLVLTEFLPFPEPYDDQRASEIAARGAS
ncbi:MAG: glycosyltransferase [Bryobacteraceae bacterium]